MFSFLRTTTSLIKEKKYFFFRSIYSFLHPMLPLLCPTYSTVFLVGGISYLNSPTHKYTHTHTFKYTQDTHMHTYYMCIQLKESRFRFQVLKNMFTKFTMAEYFLLGCAPRLQKNGFSIQFYVEFFFFFSVPFSPHLPKG